MSFTLVDSSVTWVYLLKEFCWKMEHCRFLVGLILAVLLSQGKASLGGEDILEKGRERNICTWTGLHVKVLLSASFTLPRRVVKESRAGR